jgi:hypothetical protein
LSSLYHKNCRYVFGFPTWISIGPLRQHKILRTCNNHLVTITLSSMTPLRDYGRSHAQTTSRLCRFGFIVQGGGHGISTKQS